MSQIRSIVHPTDFSDASAGAFARALKIALTAKATLAILHVASDAAAPEWGAFPRIRHTFARWGLMGENEPIPAIEAKLGIAVRKVEIMPQSTADGILRFLAEHPADMMVLATEARQGVARWLHGSVAEALARHAKMPALFVPAKANGFVDVRRGEVRLRHVVIPVDHHPEPDAAVPAIMEFAQLMAGMQAEEHLLHIGSTAPAVQRRDEPLRRLPVALRAGDAVDGIISAANEGPAGLIGMPTAGHHGVLDALRGSTTERVLRQAPCPLLAVPAGR
jgi:nucleotide-binding universal stress UspA family protein